MPGIVLPRQGRCKLPELRRNSAGGPNDPPHGPGASGGRRGSAQTSREHPESRPAAAHRRPLGTSFGMRSLLNGDSSGMALGFARMACRMDHSGTKGASGDQESRMRSRARVAIAVAGPHTFSRAERRGDPRRDRGSFCLDRLALLSEQRPRWSGGQYGGQPGRADRRPHSPPDLPGGRLPGSRRARRFHSDRRQCRAIPAPEPGSRPSAPHRPDRQGCPTAPPPNADTPEQEFGAQAAGGQAAPLGDQGTTPAARRGRVRPGCHVRRAV
jgi:hypothetical protein